LTEHYVTLFDSVFLPQGLALHHSLLEHGGDCLLWVLCLDGACHETLQRLDLPQMRLLNLAELETPELLAVKPGRSRAEYCWTLTPWSIQWVFEAEQTVQRVTYLDADVFFLKSPAPIFAEFEASGCGVLITEHGYAPEYDQTPTSGLYCVQFLPVVRGLGESILHWWRDRCIEWCFAKFENGLFGDQKYVERFASISPEVVLPVGPDSRFQAPWNCSVFKFSDAILFHFHGLRLLSRQLYIASSGAYLLPGPTMAYVYKPYCDLLNHTIELFSLELSAQALPPRSRTLRKMRWTRSLRRRLGLPFHPPYWYQLPTGNDSGYFW
jgi:hypothetical protein